MIGAETTFPSKIIANGFPIFSPVTFPNFLPPRALIEN